MVKFRFHRGLLEDSMDTVITVNSREDIAQAMSKELDMPVKSSSIGCKYYSYDKRVGWENYIITMGGNAIGFTDGEI